MIKLDRIIIGYGEKYDHPGFKPERDCRHQSLSFFWNKLSTAFFLCSILRWAYRDVVVMLRCPKSSCTVLRSLPSMTRLDAKE